MHACTARQKSSVQRALFAALTCTIFALGARVTSLKPLFDRVLVQRAEVVAKIGSIYVPETAQSKMAEGLVIATGPGARNQAGETVKMSVKEGDKVLLPEYGGEKVEIEKQEYFLFRETELLGVLS